MKTGKQVYEDVLAATLEEALDQFHDAATLGSRSPLAAPYFLGNALAGFGQGQGAVERGRALQQLLLEAAVELTVGSEDEQQQASRLHSQIEAGRGQFHDLYRDHLVNRLQGGDERQRLLYWSYFHHSRFATLDLLYDHLSLTKPTYYRHRRKAIEQLGVVLIGRTSPALRLETPPQPAELVGRESDLHACLSTLATRQTLAIVGPSGIGKTALGAMLVGRAAPRPSFWYTFRLGLNDGFHHVLFALGYFLHRQGTNRFWSQLIADAEQAIAKAPEMIRHELDHLVTAPPVLCFDEVDLLRPSEVEAHAQIYNLFESLRGVASLVCIGQTIPFESHAQHVVGGLNPPLITELFDAHQLNLSEENMRTLVQITHGNPRLIWLFITLHQSGEPLDQAIGKMSVAPSVESLVQRIWSRLADDERGALELLSVFRQLAPRDMAGLDPDVVRRLEERHMLWSDTRGGIGIVPAIREMIYRRSMPEQRAQHHQHAALVRATRAETTAATYHLLRADLAEQAVELWSAYQDQEIGQGQSEAALALFDTVTGIGMSNQAYEQLRVLRARLWKVVGEYDRALAEVRTRVWESPWMESQARRIQGNIEELRDEFDAALKSYQRGIDVAHTALATEASWLYKGRARVLMRERELEQAWQEALRARCEAEEVQGQILETWRQFERALTYYQETLRLAQEGKYPHGEAKSYHNLARLLFFLGKFDEAADYGEQAHQMFKRMGNSALQASVLVNQALGYNLAGLPAQAIPYANEAYELFKALGEPWGRAVAAQNLAEAHQALGHLDQAADYARLVVGEEERATFPDGLRVLGEVHLAQGDAGQAERFVRQSVQMAQQNTDRFLEGYGWRALGRVYLAQGRLAEAVESLERAITLFTELVLLHEVEATRRYLPTRDDEGGYERARA